MAASIAVRRRETGGEGKDAVAEIAGWASVVVTVMAGVSLADLAARLAGSGYGWVIVSFGLLITLSVSLLRRQTSVSWTAAHSVLALTFALGALMTDWIASAPGHGGLGFGPGPTGAALAVLVIALLTPLSANDTRAGLRLW
ncbi:hypothetical protein [Kitasatospora sp. NPDC093679]|uniref:hypothetical protein n=1 Tax=Kitasatospora sp. NPDC093679 TaxID=3154983 RepID=UPI0034420392